MSLHLMQNYSQVSCVLNTISSIGSEGERKYILPPSSLSVQFQKDFNHIKIFLLCIFPF